MTTPSPGIGQAAEQSRRLVAQAGAMARQATDQIDNGKFGFNEWSRSMLEFIDLALTAAVDVAPAMMMPIPCFPKPSDEPERSDYIKVPRATDFPRKISAVGPFVRDGQRSFVIPPHLISFEPAMLPSGQKRFRVAVTWPHLRSGTYRGRVILTATARIAPDEFDVIINL
jgi:hypothetical protein